MSCEKHKTNIPESGNYVPLFALQGGLPPMSQFNNYINTLTNEFVKNGGVVSNEVLNDMYANTCYLLGYRDGKRVGYADWKNKTGAKIPSDDKELLEKLNQAWFKVKQFFTGKITPQNDARAFLVQMHEMLGDDSYLYGLLKGDPRYIEHFCKNASIPVLAEIGLYVQPALLANRVSFEDIVARFENGEIKPEDFRFPRDVNDIAPNHEAAYHFARMFFDDYQRKYNGLYNDFKFETSDYDNQNRNDYDDQYDYDYYYYEDENY